MADFTNPFSGNIPDRKMTHGELLRAIRLDLAAEEEANNIYLAHADATDNELAKAVLRDIADEERVHAGEFQRLLSILAEDEERLLKKGADEVNEMAGNLTGGKAEAEQEKEKKPESSGGSPPTVGNMKQ